MTSMPQWPHEHIVRDQVDEELFERLVVHIRKHGSEGKSYERAITRCEGAGLVYWTMGAPLQETSIVSRCRGQDTYEHRLARGTLPWSTGEATGIVDQRRQLPCKPQLRDQLPDRSATSPRRVDCHLAPPLGCLQAESTAKPGLLSGRD